jgi:hypothetical protein
MGEHTHTLSFGGRRAALGFGVGAAVGAALALLRRTVESGVGAGRQAGADGESVVAEPPAYEYLSRVAWSDHTRGVTADLEDAEGLEVIARDGWELVHVIVPFAQTRHLDVSYPGNTRKLIAYYRRPKGWEEQQ